MSIRIDRAARHRIPAIIEPFPSDRPFPAPQPPVLCGLVSQPWFWAGNDGFQRSEEHTSELQSLMRISYAVFCLKKKTHNTQKKALTHCSSYDIYIISSNTVSGYDTL